MLCGKGWLTFTKKESSFSHFVGGSFLFNQITTISKQRIFKDVEHYISRYGVESILEYAPQDKINFLRKYIEEKNRRTK